MIKNNENKILTFKFEEEICETIECRIVCYENKGQIWNENYEFNNNKYKNREVTDELSDIETIFKNNT